MKFQTSKMSHLHRNTSQAGLTLAVWHSWENRGQSFERLPLFWGSQTKLWLKTKDWEWWSEGLWASHQWVRRQHMTQNFWQSQHMQNTCSSKFQAWNLVFLKWKIKRHKNSEVHFRFVVLGPARGLIGQRFMLPSLKTWRLSLEPSWLKERASS